MTDLAFVRITTYPSSEAPNFFVLVRNDEDEIPENACRRRRV